MRYNNNNNIKNTHMAKQKHFSTHLLSDGAEGKDKSSQIDWKWVRCWEQVALTSPSLNSLKLNNT